MVRGSWAVAAVGLAAVGGWSAPVSAGVIVAPIGAEVLQGGSQTAISNTFNQSGLNRAYVSGVTDFDDFFRPRTFHTPQFTNDWFAASAGPAIVVYDLGAVGSFASLAFWSEDAYGVNQFELLYSADGLRFTSLGNFSPTDAPPSGSAFGDRFDFSVVDARYFRLNLNSCPTGPMVVCSIGEVAFNRVAATSPAVPEPATWGMLLLGFGGLGHAMRRRYRVTACVRFA